MVISHDPTSANDPDVHGQDHARGDYQHSAEVLRASVEQHLDVDSKGCCGAAIAYDVGLGATFRAAGGPGTRY